jgi:hypothetical protein
MTGIMKTREERREELKRLASMPNGIDKLYAILTRNKYLRQNGLTEASRISLQAVPAAHVEVPLAITEEEALVGRLNNVLGIDLALKGSPNRRRARAMSWRVKRWKTSRAASSSPVRRRFMRLVKESFEAMQPSH